MKLRAMEKQRKTYIDLFSVWSRSGTVISQLHEATNILLLDLLQA